MNHETLPHHPVRAGYDRLLQLPTWRLLLRPRSWRFVRSNFDSRGRVVRSRRDLGSARAFYASLSSGDEALKAYSPPYGPLLRAFSFLVGFHYSFWPGKMQGREHIADRNALHPSEPIL